jgi:hypothetical protein
MSSEIEQKAGWVKFQQFHQPTLAAGDYQITIDQAVNITDHATAISAFRATKDFTVASERFDLNPTDVLGVFPPDGNLGEHLNVLPHIILNRSTLPWERTAEVRNAPRPKGEAATPWLALLLFDEDQKPKATIVKASDLTTPPPAGTKCPVITLEKAQQPTDMLTVIDVPHDLLKQIMPTADELTLLAHVRFGADDKGNPIGDELAVIIANRLPQPGKTSFVHLVSVEGRFTEVAQKYQFDYGNAAGNDLIRLVSLKSWSFACEDPKKEFKELLLALNATPSTLKLPSAPKSAEELVNRGYVLLPHHFRGGDQTGSWFHGPLVPGKNQSPQFDLPARSADELVRYDRDLAMFDVSYAAAWELGRLLALQDKDFSTGLYQWKREHAQQVARQAQRSQNSHLPFQSATSVFVPETISAWFKSLRKLEGVPFNYLVPDERMLPAESIRFFRVDPAWVHCLADGAFSIGRVASSDHEADRAHGQKSPAAGLAPMLTGFLLRSEVVSGWPGLVVDGYADAGGQKPVLMHRMDRLSSGVLICIFWGEVSRVDIHLKAETLHFGLAHSKGVFSKKLRDEKGAATDNTVTLRSAHWRAGSPRTLNITAFQQTIRVELKMLSGLTSAQFALQMVEGVENIVFTGA